MAKPEGRNRPSADVLQVLAGLEPDGAAGWNPDLFARPWVAADPSLARLHLEYAEASQLDAVAALHRHAHGVEYRIDGYLGLDFGDVGHPRDFVDDVDLDHARTQMTVTIIGKIGRAHV